MLKAVLVALAAVLGSGLVAAGAFALLGTVLTGVPHPGWGLVGGSALAVASYVRTGLADRAAEHAAPDQGHHEGHGDREADGPPLA